eukprot:1401511-Pleurochrysis_carterae.AAC.1
MDPSHPCCELAVLHASRTLPPDERRNGRAFMGKEHRPLQHRRLAHDNLETRPCEVAMISRKSAARMTQLNKSSLETTADSPFQRESLTRFACMPEERGFCCTKASGPFICCSFGHGT